MEKNRKGSNDIAHHQPAAARKRRQLHLLWSLGGCSGLLCLLATLIGLSTLIAKQDAATLLASPSSVAAQSTYLYSSNWTARVVAGNPSSQQGFMDSPASSSSAIPFSSLLCSPTSLTISTTQNTLYFVDKCNNAIRKMSLSTYAVSTVAGSLSGLAGSVDGAALSGATFNKPWGLALDDANGLLYISDSGNGLIRKLNLASMMVTTLAGVRTSVSASSTTEAGTLGLSILVQPTLSSMAGYFSNPTGLAFDSFTGNLFISDSTVHLIKKISTWSSAALSASAASPAPVTIFSGIGSPGSSNGLYNTAYFNSPVGLAFNPFISTLYVADSTNNLIRTVDSQGNVTTLAGDAFMAAVNYPGTPSIFNNPQSLSVDIFGSGSIFIADTYYGMVRVIANVSVGNGGAPVKTLGGTGLPACVDGIGSASSFFYPSGIVVNGSRSLFVADTFSNSIRLLYS